MDSYTSHALYSKWMVDWHDTQLSGPPQDTEKPHIFGNVPNTAPTFDGAGSPMWGGITVLLPYELYRRHGDLRMLQTAVRQRPFSSQELFSLCFRIRLQILGSAVFVL